MKITDQNKLRVTQYMKMVFLLDGWDTYHDEGDDHADTMKKATKAYKKFIKTLGEAEFDVLFENNLELFIEAFCAEVKNPYIDIDYDELSENVK